MAVSPAQIQQFLSGVDYPCDKQQLVDHAEEQGADDDVLEALRNLPADSFDSANEVSEAFGDIEDGEE